MLSIYIYCVQGNCGLWYLKGKVYYSYLLLLIYCTVHLYVSTCISYIPVLKYATKRDHINLVRGVQMCSVQYSKGCLVPIAITFCTSIKTPKNEYTSLSSVKSKSRALSSVTGWSILESLGDQNIVSSTYMAHITSSLKYRQGSTLLWVKPSCVSPDFRSSLSCS